MKYSKSLLCGLVLLGCHHVLILLVEKLSKHPEKFGTGMIQGVAGPEAANNAATG
jgi:TctA family transporter